MHRLLLPIILLSTFATKNAFAEHAYRSEVCMATGYNLFYQGNYPIGGLYGMTLTKDRYDNPISALPLLDSGISSSLEDAEVIFNVTDVNIYAESEPSSSCGFEHKQWRSEKTISISMISSAASAKLGLKQGEELLFICKESSDVPDNSQCD